MARARLAALLVAPLAFGLTACGGDDTGGLPTVSSAPTESSSSTPATSATPTVAPTTAPASTTQKYGALTLVINHKPTPPANATLVLQAYDEFEQSSNKAQATNVEDQVLARRATGAALQYIRDALKEQKAAKERTGGQITVTTKVAKIGSGVAGLDTCYDQSKSTLIRADGTSYRDSVLKQYPRLKVSVILVNISGIWKVSEYNVKSEAC
ncbi:MULTISPECIES: hypothetical protein [unclassified Kribbella]|uniref:hypothetical protein n=1 Tax=unclassified Kribbella TaxID=2644121 RepID=UPI00301705E8